MPLQPLIGEELRGVATEFIDYARWIISFLIVYYVIRFFTVSDDAEDQKKEAEWKDRGEKYSEYINDVVQKSKDKNALKSRQLHVTPAEQHIIDSLKSAEEGLDAITDKKYRAYTSKLKSLNSNLDHSIKSLRSARHNFPTTFNINAKISTLAALRDDLNNNLLAPAHLPTTDAALAAGAPRFKTELTKIRDSITPVLDEVKKYVHP